MPVEEVMPVEIWPVAIAAIVNPVEAAVAMAAVEYGRGVIAPAVKRNTAAVEASAMKASSTVEATASMETTTAVPATTAVMPDLGRQTAGRGFHGRCRTWARQRQCLGALLRCRREHKYRGRGNAKATK